MADTTAPVDMDDEPVSAAQTPPPSATEDWQNRFKGLQRSYNAQQGVLTKKDKEIADLKAQLDQMTSSYEERITTLTSQLEPLKSATSELELTKSQLATMQRDAEIRKTLGANEQYRDLLPWFDAGYLSIGEKAGDELTQYLDGFKSMLGNKSAAEFAKTMNGATAPGAAPDAIHSPMDGQMSEAELATWLYQNPGHSDYAQMNEQYIQVVSKRISS